MANTRFILLSSYNKQQLIVNVDNIVYINDYDPLYTIIYINIFRNIKKYKVNKGFFDIVNKIKNLNNKTIYHNRYEEY